MVVHSRREILAHSLLVGSAVLPVSARFPPPRTYDVRFDFETQNPFEWLLTLVLAKVNGQHAVVTGDAPQDWLQIHHIDSLLEMAESEIECASVGSRRSSNSADYEVQTPSKIGHEAMYLISSFRHGLFPMSHRNSTLWPMDLKELKQWWVHRKAEAVSNGE